MAKKGPAVDVVASNFSPLDLGELVVGHLATKAFCTIDVGIESSSLSKAYQESMEIAGQGNLRRPPAEIVDGLLGEHGSAEISELELGDDGATPLSTGEGLHTVDKAMSKVAACAKSFFPALGFESSERTPAILHLTRTPEGEPPQLTEAEASEWLFQFLKGMVMCVVPIGPDAGTLVLEPYEEDAEVFEIAVRPGIAVVLRVDTLLVTHRCEGTSFLLSCFFLDSRSLEDKRNIEVPLTPAVEKLTAWATTRLDTLKTQEEEDKKPDVPKQWLKTMNQQSFKGQHMAARGVGTRLPVTWDPDLFFSTSFWGVDYMMNIPFIRWDHTHHYDPNPEAWRYYKTYAKHVAYFEGVELFDNKMFSISPAESKVMDPQQRVVLECGYEALYAAGLKKGKIMGSLGGMYLGYGTGTSDFNFVERTNDAGAEGSFGATGGSAAITANRFSFCLGMKGASLAIDAEDASGLVAVHLGCEALQRKGRGQVNTFSLAGGLHINMAVFYWPQRQAAGLLSPSGRAKTFDAQSDGCGQGDAACNITLRQLMEVVDNQVILQGDSEPLLGVVAASSMNCSGRNTNLNAPHGPSQQELLSNCLRAACLNGFDVEGMECYGAGGLLSDAIEASSTCRTLRGREGDFDSLGMSCIKSSAGNGNHGAGAVSFVRTLFSNLFGLITPGLHLYQLNPHLDTADDPMQYVSEAVEFVQRSSYVGSFARGWAGTNAGTFAWGRVEDERVQPAPRAPERERLIFWPGGGGSLDSGLQPRKGYHIAGTFTEWNPEPMEMERSGVYTFEFTLSENRWEQFQIWLDGDPKRCLHPEDSKASRLTKVLGPDPTPEGNVWYVEGRTDSSSLEAGGIDRALIGARYRVRLYCTGKYRMVDWERLTGRAELEDQAAVVAEAAQALPQSAYFVSADWNGWGFEQMAESGDGRYFLDVHVLRLGGEFQIVRNRDFEQVLYPEDSETSGDASNVSGPDDQSLGRSWYLNGRRGNTFRIELSRVNQNGLDMRNVSWTKTGDQELTDEEKKVVQRPRYAVCGSWNKFSRMRELKWNGSYYYCFIELGSEGKEDFQLTQDFDWGKVFHPQTAEAGLGVDVAGPASGDSVANLCWTIGKEGYEKPGDIFELRAYHKESFFLKILYKVEWVKVAGSRDLQEDSDEGLILRSRR